MKGRLVTALFLLVPALAAGVPAQNAGPNTFTVWLPGKPWVMEMDAPGFTIRANEIQKDGRRYFVAENPETNVILSVYLEEGKAPATAEGCKRGLHGRATSNLPFKRSGITFRESGAAQILEYSILEVDGVPQNQRNLFACLTKDNVFADLHLSKVFFKAWDQPLFDALLQSVRFPSREPVANSVPIGNSLEYFQQGSRFFLARQYKEAIEPYSKALEIEKVTPTLDHNLWRGLCLWRLERPGVSPVLLQPRLRRCGQERRGRGRTEPEAGLPVPQEHGSRRAVPGCPRRRFVPGPPAQQRVPRVRRSALLTVSIIVLSVRGPEIPA